MKAVVKEAATSAKSHRPEGRMRVFADDLSVRSACWLTADLLPLGAKGQNLNGVLATPEMRPRTDMVLEQ